MARRRGEAGGDPLRHIDSTAGSGLALLVNSAILITAAAVFHAGGRTEVAEIQEAYELLTPWSAPPSPPPCSPWRCWPAA